MEATLPVNVGFARRTPHPWRQVPVVFLFILGLILATTNVLLVQQNRNLRNQVKGLLEPPLGARVPNLSGFDVEGSRMAVAYGQDHRKTLLLVLSPNCSVCNANWPNWDFIRMNTNREAVRTIFVDPSSRMTKDYANAHNISGTPVIAKLDPQSTLDYNLRVTPLTILISNDGRIEGVWAGLLRADAIRDISKAIHPR